MSEAVGTYGVTIPVRSDIIAAGLGEAEWEHEGEAQMAVRINLEPDNRATQMMEDPAGYFKAERDRIRAEVLAELGEPLGSDGREWGRLH